MKKSVWKIKNEENLELEQIRYIKRFSFGPVVWVEYYIARRQYIIFVVLSALYIVSRFLNYGKFYLYFISIVFISRNVILCFFARRYVLYQNFSYKLLN